MIRNQTERQRSAGLIRILRLARRLEGLTQAPPLRDLARELHVCARTIRRDLTALEQAGWLVPRWRHPGPRIGPCRDPLELWYLEFTDDKGRFRKYYANRAEARAALRELKAVS